MSLATKNSAPWALSSPRSAAFTASIVPSVICVFPGADLDLPYARMVYGQDFVRIRDHSQFADAVGKLILDQMKQYAT